MQLTEQHIIERDDPRFAVVDAAAFQSKNLYNAALYEMRQAFIFQCLSSGFCRVAILPQRMGGDEFGELHS